MLLYVFLSTDLSEGNPLATMRFDKRVEEAEKVVFRDKKMPKLFSKKELLDIEAAREEYKKEFYTDYHRDMQAYDRKIDELNDLLVTTKPKIIKNVKESNGFVIYSTNITIINDILKDVVNLIMTKTNLISSYINGNAHTAARGSTGFSPLSKGTLKVQTDNKDN